MSACKFDLSQYEFYEIGILEDLPEGERMFLDIKNIPMVVFNIQGEFFAIKDICTHDEGPLGEGDLEGHEIICPRHGAHFDLCSGVALTAPAFVDNDVFPVITDGEKIKVGLLK